MIENDLHIALVYQEPIISSEVVSGFEEDIKVPKLNVKVEPVPMMGARAGVEWFLPTAIVAYIAKPYFESFLSEMGRDHYVIAKNALKNLQSRIMAKFSDRLKVYSTIGKIHPEANKFSPVFSIEAQSVEGLRFKLLIQTDINPNHFEEAVEAFLPFVAGNQRFEEIVSQASQLPGYKNMRSVILVCYSEESGKLELINPFPDRNKP